MRRAVLAVMLILFCGLLGSFANSEELNLSSMSDAELNDLRTRVEEEIANRDGFLQSFYTQDIPYIVGKDIEAGDYMISCVKKTISMLTGAKLRIWNTKKSYEECPDNSEIDMFVALDQTVRINIEEGNILFIQGGILSFNKMID